MTNARTKMKGKPSINERSFTVELDSKRDLKHITVSNGTHEGVVIEGSLGKLKRAGFAEGILLEIVGTNGVLRIDIGDSELEHKRGTREKGEF